LQGKIGDAISSYMRPWPWVEGRHKEHEDGNGVEFELNKLCGLCIMAATLCPRLLQVVWPFDLESGVRVTYDVG